jgi:hypothetical protein
MPGYDLETSLLYTALTSALGIVVAIAEPSRATVALNRLYRARAEAGDPELARLQIRRNPKAPDSEFWIIKLAVAPPSPDPEVDTTQPIDKALNKVNI